MAHEQGQATTAVSEQDIIAALQNPMRTIFMTTTLFWDCECWNNYIRPADMPMCENCGQLREESPNSRINEIKNTGIHIMWNDRKISETLSIHGSHYRSADP